MDETVEERLAAVERALTDDDHDLSALAEAGDLAERVETLEARVEEYESRTAELEAATQALRGYVGNVRAVNEDVRQRADRALRVAQGDGESPDSERERDGTAGEGSTTEPTLELEANEGSKRQSQHGDHTPSTDVSEHTTTSQQRATGTRNREHTKSNPCPLCEGDGTRDRANGSAGRDPPAAGRESQSTDRDRTGRARDEGLTDGGTVGTETTPTAEEDAGLLRQIRTLL